MPAQSIANLLPVEIHSGIIDELCLMNNVLVLSKLMLVSRSWHDTVIGQDGAWKIRTLKLQHSIEKAKHSVSFSPPTSYSLHTFVALYGTACFVCKSNHCARQPVDHPYQPKQALLCSVCRGKDAHSTTIFDLALTAICTCKKSFTCLIFHNMRTTADKFLRPSISSPLRKQNSCADKTK